MFNFKAFACDSETARRAFLSTVVLVISFRVLLIVNLPLRIFDESIHDDTLFMHLAMSLASGDWLGTFDQNTLIKGPGYPAFLAVSALSGLPVTLTHALFQGAALAATAWAVHRITRSYAVAAIVCVVLALHPIGFTIGVQRVIREQIFWGQSLLVVSLFAVLFLSPPRAGWKALAFACGAGLLLGWTWLTREEGALFVFALVVLLAGAIVRHLKSRAELTRIARCGFVAVAAFLATQLAFQSINLAVYGDFVGVDVKERNFVAALNSLQRIDTGPVLPLLPVPLAARTDAAKVSPTFAPLASTLAPGGADFGWGVSSCRRFPATCGDIAGGWFMWAFRDAAARQGFYGSPKIARKMFKRLADELAAACKDHRLRCRRGWIDYMPAISDEQWKSLPRSMATITGRVIFYDPLSAPRQLVPPEKATSARFLKYWTFLNSPRIESKLFEHSRVADAAHAVRDGLVQLYGRMAPPLVLAGFVAFVVAAVRSALARQLSAVLVVSVACWALVGGRIVLLALIDVSSFPIINYRFTSPIAYVAVVAAILSMVALRTDRAGNARRLGRLRA